MELPESEFAPGQVIAGRYQVQRILGRGGMGVVYLVMDTETGEARALKTLRAHYMADENAVRRFMREVNALSQLRHPAIVRIHEARKVGDTLFYTMDYIKGKTLFRWVKQRGRLGLGSTVRILALVAHGLEHAHKVTIHRDISLENVMVLSDGSVRLLDFGLAKLSDPQGTFTLIGDRLGKAQYKAPEQALDAGSVDCRADIYSLGVMFHVMLSGKFPKPGRRLTELVPDLPKECDAFVEKATALSPEDRFSSAREFRLALMRVYEASKAKDKGADRPEQEEAPQAPEEDTRPRRRLVSGALKSAWEKLAGWWRK